MFKSRTHEEFVSIVNEKGRGQFTVIGEYVNNIHPIEIKCNSCGETFIIKPANFLRNVHCRICSKRAKKNITHEVFVKLVRHDVGDEYTVVGQYTSMQNKVRMRHNVCGAEYEVRASKFREHAICPVCRNKVIRNSEEFQREINEITDEYIVVGEYINSTTKVDLLHTVCGNIYSVKRDSFIGRGCRCPTCSGHVPVTNEVFIARLKEKHGDNIIALDEFSCVHTKIRFQCSTCKYIWLAEPNSVAGSLKTACPKCSGRVVTDEEFKEAILKKHNGRITPLQKYTTAFVKMEFLCNVCKCKWSATPASVKQGHGCPVCSASKGELAINDYLQKHGIPYEVHQPFDGLVGTGGGLLSYDFYLKEYNLLIEFQGIQHEKPVDFLGLGMDSAIEQFEKQKIHDDLKRNYAKDNSIELMEIWYYDFDNIDSILTKYFLDNQAVA